MINHIPAAQPLGVAGTNGITRTAVLVGHVQSDGDTTFDYAYPWYSWSVSGTSSKLQSEPLISCTYETQHTEYAR